MARTKVKGAHYVDNKKFHQAMIDWKEKCKDAEEAGDEVPQITDYIGSCFLKIANGLSYRPNFINYSYFQSLFSIKFSKPLGSLLESFFFGLYTASSGTITFISNPLTE